MPPRITASATVPGRPEEVFDFLSDLDNHWVLAGPFVDVVTLAGLPGERHGGRVTVRGPLGIRRMAATRVRAVDRPVMMRGDAYLATRTRATVTWTLAPALGGTRVRLAATVDRADATDRLLLLLGGRLWLRRRFAGTLRALVRHFERGRELASPPPTVALEAKTDTR